MVGYSGDSKAVRKQYTKRFANNIDVEQCPDTDKSLKRLKSVKSQLVNNAHMETSVKPQSAFCDADSTGSPTSS